MTLATPSANTLFYGDNLAILRQHFSANSVDLIYLDPPFNSKASYNVLYKEPTGAESRAQIEAFDDTWHWGETAERAFDEAVHSGNSDAAEMLIAMRRFLKENDMMAYLAMMAVRLIELHRVLKPTGSLYLHCDPTASHYLKILLDAVFGKKGYRTEISWKRSSAHNDARQGRVQYGNIRDVIFYYTKSNRWTWNWQFTKYHVSYTAKSYRHVDSNGRRFRRDNLTAAKPGGDVSYGWPIKRPIGGAWQADLESEHVSPKDDWEYAQVPPYNGRFWAFSKAKMREMEENGLLIYASSGMPEFKRYLDEMRGVPLQNGWDDIPPVIGKDDLGYPTQKPLALLERIISASSNPGDLVLDPFCGCGTTIHAAQKLGRRWIGIDVTHLAIGLVRRRLIDAFPLAAFDVVGLPKDMAGARELATADKHEFQLWALATIGAQQYRGGKKGADGGVDGYIYFKPDGKATEKAVISVKGGGNVGIGVIKDLRTTIENEKAKVGILVALAEPTGPMKKEAASAGLYKTEIHGSFPRIQILTIADLFDGEKPRLPWIDSSVFKKAKEEKGKQENLNL